VDTRTGVPAVQGVNEIYFNLFLPSGAMPPGGWPIAIYGHGVTLSKDGFLSLNHVAASMAAQGIATIGINAVGHGRGPLGTLTVNESNGVSVTFPAGGRGINQDGNGEIGASEGLQTARPRAIISTGDGLRQTVADLMQLVRVIKVGMDVDGDGLRDLKPSRIYYVGFSMGGFYGTLFLAVEPNVRAGVLTVAGGPAANLLFSPGNRIINGRLLATRTPSLINSPGITYIEGVAVAPPQFNENIPLRNGMPLAVRLADGTISLIQSPMINTVAGAIEIQDFFEKLEWVMQSGTPVAYAPHLRKAPLAGVPAKSVIVQFAKGDQSVPNPATTALLRAGDLTDRATCYRHDLAFAENPALRKDPHSFMPLFTMFGAVSLGAQQQIAVFFASKGKMVIHPEPARFFHVPMADPLPEALNYIP